MTEETYRSAQRVAAQLEESGLTEPVKRASAERIAADFEHFLVLTKKVINQTQRRAIDEERVPAEEKVVSIFEEHTDIIRKDRRETLYGHKVCMTGGSSSMILDCVILDGNPSDSTLAETMIDRQVELYERAPRQVAYDGAFSSKANLEAIKGKGVEDVAFTKAHFAVTDMVKSSWVYQRLRRFRCGIEGVISFLKRVFGLDRCTWRSLPSFNPNRKIFEARKRETAALGAGEKLVLGHPLAATIGDSARCMQNLEKVLFTGQRPQTR